MDHWQMLCREHTLLIFLGVFKTSVKQLKEWLKGRNKADSFHHFAKVTLNSVSSLSISLSCVLPYMSGKFTGWISENFFYIFKAHHVVLCSSGINWF